MAHQFVDHAGWDAGVLKPDREGVAQVSCGPGTHSSARHRCCWVGRRCAAAATSGLVLDRQPGGLEHATPDLAAARPQPPEATRGLLAHPSGSSRAALQYGSCRSSAAERIVGMVVVVISDALREARAACERAFAFLVADFGYRRDRRRFQWAGFLLRYRGPVIGVQVAWYPRDELTVWLVKLVDGDFPPYPMTIHPETELHYFDLGDLEAISGQHRQVSQRQLYALPTDQTARLLADNLRGCGADLLRGDLTQLPLLEQRIRDRARTQAIAQVGAERARELGW